MKRPKGLTRLERVVFKIRDGSYEEGQNLARRLGVGMEKAARVFLLGREYQRLKKKFGN